MLVTLVTHEWDGWMLSVIESIFHWTIKSSSAWVSSLEEIFWRFCTVSIWDSLIEEWTSIVESRISLVFTLFKDKDSIDKPPIRIIVQMNQAFINEYSLVTDIISDSIKIKHDNRQR